MSELDDLYVVINSLDLDKRVALLRHLQKALPRHPIEVQLMASTETILDALARSSELTIRGIKGVIAEASFAADVAPTLSGWQTIPVASAMYDFVLQDAYGQVSIQVKMQRTRAGTPLKANAIAKKWGWPESYFIVETQKTRGGKNASGDLTRPYRFGQFDILAVSMGASSSRWSDFRYTVSRWLIPDPINALAIFKYQPVAPFKTHRWTDQFEEAVEWFRSGAQGLITDSPFE